MPCINALLRGLRHNPPLLFQRSVPVFPFSRLLLLRAALAWLCLALVHPAARAATVEPASLAAREGGVSLVPHMEVLEDPGRRLGIGDILSPGNAARFVHPDDPLRGAESDRVLWFRVQLRLADPADAQREWLLVVPTISTHELRFYGPCGPDGRALAPPVVTGMRHPWATRPAGSEQMAWRFRLPDAQTYTAYFRVESTFARFYAVTAWDLADYLQSTQDKRMFDGACYGLLLGLLAFSLAMLLVFREGIYAWYSLSCACALLALASLNGHTLRYPFAHSPAAAGLFYTLAPPLWAMSKLLFGRSLLRLSHYAPRIDRLVLALVAVLGAATVYGLFGPHPLWLFRAVQASVMVSTTVLAAGALIAVRRRYWPAVLYSAGVLLLLLGICAIIVASWGWLAWTPGQMDLTQAALVAEAVIFAAAMASRLRLLRMSEQALGRRTRELVEVLGTDALTGAANRAGLARRAEAALEAGEPFTLMLLDLDGFKAVNDTHGHAAGDAVLVALVQRLRALLRDGDLVARLGGDEFAVLLAGAPPRTALADKARAMANAVVSPLGFEGRNLAVGLSVGIARHPGDGRTLESLLRAADAAMYASKRRGPQEGADCFAFASDLATVT
ncbi:diguanylate cyclase (GGDEF) domain-containing protein [Paracidovorax cattleyae]|uniref:Diguanylate cyclase (GGDEF) domain-containing protein n=2 Tax=Paracidovorax cattleyae TaxID=80868 RepID=A0A1H0MV00_9BURK|nr:diguanylate cyclase (GGDEF) domain-containing protein [Paracidovorax cattleyae]